MAQLRSRAGLCAVACAMASLLAAAPASADLQSVVGARTVVTGEPVSSCSAKAKAALDSVLQNAFGSEDGWDWLAYGAPDRSGNATSGAAINCYQLGDGYLVTFTCAAQVPPNPDTAATICTKLVAAFPGAKAAAWLPSRGGRR